MKIKLWGNKGDAFFDRWTFGHIFTHYFFAKLFLINFLFLHALLIMLAASYIWELLETFLESWDRKKYLFKQKENWINRYISDILANLTGFLLAWFII